MEKYKKKRKRIAVISSSDDEVVEKDITCNKKGKAIVENSSAVRECKVIVDRRLLQNTKNGSKMVSGKFLDSSDEENLQPEAEQKSPSNHQRWKSNLEKLCLKRKEKQRKKERKIQYDDCEHNSSENELKKNSIESKISPLFTEEEEQMLPNFQHEEAPPESESSTEDDENDFINDDDDDSGNDSSKAESLEGESDHSDSLEAYKNPYMERNEALERQDILQILSKSTEKDKTNKKCYKKEMGRYQLAIHTERNRALQISNKQRYYNHMAQARHDMSLKEERNIERGDDEFYYSKTLTILGDKVQVFPHSKRITRYSSRCELPACNDKFEAGFTEIIGIKKLSEFDLQFRKKPSRNHLNKENFYWICASHCPPSILEDSSSSSSSASSDDE